MKTGSQNLALAALFIALGLLIPILFHALNLGKVFLPMFLPMSMAAFLVRWKYALAVAALTPLVSSLLTGMPPLSPPIAQIMVFEGVVLVAVTAWGFFCWGVGTFLPLAAGLFASRVVLYLFISLLAPIIGLPRELAAIVKVLEGLPGVIMILIVTPFLVNRLSGEPVLAKR